VAVFELGGALAPALSELAIGPWRSAPDLPSFDAAAGGTESLWRVGLARDPAANRAALAGGERSIAHTHALLDDAPRRLDRLSATRRVAARPGGAGAFDRELAADGPYLSGDQAHEPGRLERALLRAGDLARGRARIETRVEDALVARTLTTLSGDLELWIAPGPPSAGAQLHVRSVAVAVRTRHAWARILTLVLSTASRIATIGATGGVTALVMAWRLLRDLLREVRDPAPSAAG
jgi:hypothetical protein